jgi:hypothetical protein
MHRRSASRRRAFSDHHQTGFVENSDATEADKMAAISRKTRAFGLAAMLAGCGDNQDDAGARDLLARVRSENYPGWSRAPGWETRRATSAPHADLVDIYVNEMLLEAYDAAGSLDAWPLGSIIVKDGWSGSDLELIAIMEKRTNGWFWAEYDSDGDPIYSGQPELCIDCHRSGSDHVRAFVLP